jgi:multidrug resistance efflux pump
MGVLTAACGGLPGATGAGTPTPIPTVFSEIEIVAEGRIVPRDSVQLAFFTNGQVDEVLVEEGDQVTAGEVVARLGNREQIEASIAGAEAELLAAEQAKDTLYDQANVAKAAAAQAIAAANRALKSADYNMDNFTVSTYQDDLTAEEGIVAMKELLDVARDAFEPYKFKASGDVTRKRLKEDLDNAQSEYNSAVRRLELETALQQAQAQLEKAHQDFQKVKDGPDPDAVAAVDSRINAAETSLAAAKASLDNLDLKATIDGKVVNQDLVVGQLVTAGQPVMQIADFSQVFAETDDLTEIEVVDVSIGQKVKIVADALPDLEFTGTVDSINEVFEEKRGDITYTARILLDEVDPRLRWGMTVVTTFLK